MRIILLLLFATPLWAQSPKRSPIAKYTESELANKINRYGCEIGPNTVFVEGGAFDMGQDSSLRRVTVSSFFLDETEVCNRHYRNFLNWTAKYKPDDLQALLPDTAAWERNLPADKKQLAERLKRDYFRDPAFDYHPVVGVSWVQAQAYCGWRQLCYKRILEASNNIPILEIQPVPNSADLARAIYKDGSNFLMGTRLPTEAEWEYAASDRARLLRSSKSTLEPMAQKHARKHPVPDYYQQNQAILPKQVFANADKNAGLCEMNSGVSEWMMDEYRVFKKSELVGVEVANLNEVVSDSMYRRPSNELDTKLLRDSINSLERVYKGVNNQNTLLKTRADRAPMPANTSAPFIGIRCARTVGRSYELKDWKVIP